MPPHESSRNVFLKSGSVSGEDAAQAPHAAITSSDCSAADTTWGATGRGDGFWGGWRQSRRGWAKQGRWLAVDGTLKQARESAGSHQRRSPTRSPTSTHMHIVVCTREATHPRPTQSMQGQNTCSRFGAGTPFLARFLEYTARCTFTMHYDLLGVPQSASIDEIKAAYVARSGALCDRHLGIEVHVHPDLLAERGQETCSCTVNGGTLGHRASV